MGKISVHYLSMQCSDTFNRMNTRKVRPNQKIPEKTDLFIAFDAILAETEGRGGEGKRGFKDNSCVGFGGFEPLQLCPQLFKSWIALSTR